MLQKKLLVLLWRPLFVGAPVRPNMLNMPKSASAQIGIASNRKVKAKGNSVPKPRSTFVAKRVPRL